MLLFCPVNFKNVISMNSKIYLNHEFFDKILGSYYPVLDNIFLHVISKHAFSSGHKIYHYYDCNFVVYNDSFDKGFITVFNFIVNVDIRKIQITRLSYCIDSDFMVANVKYFPISPAWLLPATNYEKWLNRCKLSLRVYRKLDYI